MNPEHLPGVVSMPGELAADQTKLAVLRMTLELAVAGWIDRWRDAGDGERVARVRELSRTEDGRPEGFSEAVLFRSEKKGETAKEFNRLAEAVALLSFCPGGVTVFGLHWESKPTSAACHARPPQGER